MINLDMNEAAIEAFTIVLALSRATSGASIDGANSDIARYFLCDFFFLAGDDPLRLLFRQENCITKKNLSLA